MELVSKPDELRSLIKNNSLVVVKFSTPWCTVCKALAKTFDSASSDYPDVVFCEADASGQIMEEYGIRSVPYTTFYVNGSAVENVAGTYGKNELYRIIDKMLVGGVGFEPTTPSSQG